jgi:hypothetical protein
MKLTQLPLLPTEEKKAKPTISDMPYGEAFRSKGKLLMRVKPTQFLLNSTIVSDVLNRGDAFVVNIETGTLYITKGSNEATLWDVRIFDQGEKKS